MATAKAGYGFIAPDGGAMHADTHMDTETAFQPKYSPMPAGAALDIDEIILFSKT